MSETDRESSARSSRRRRWEVQSKESFATSLAVKLDTPDKVKKSADKKKKFNKSSNKDEYSSSIDSKDDLNPFTKDCIADRKNKKIVRSSNTDQYKSSNDSKDDLNPFNNDGISDKISAILVDATTNDLENKILYENNPYDSPCPPYCEEATPTAPLYSPSTENLIDSTLINKSSQYEINIISSKISQQLHKLSEDIIEAKYLGNETTIPGVAVSGLLLGPSSSSFNGNVSTIYCEKLNNFVVTNEDQLVASQQNEPFQDLLKKQTRATYATFLQTGFRTFSVTCQGVFAGIAIAHSIMVFMLQENFDLFFNINSLEHLFYSLMIFLSSVCLVSAFDRCDLAGHGILSENGLRIPWTPLFYFLCFTLSLIMIRAEDFITFFHSYPNNIQNKKIEMITWWKFMTLARSSAALLGWVALVSDPHTDALNSRIAELSLL